MEPRAVSLTKGIEDDFYYACSVGQESTGVENGLFLFAHVI